MEKFEIHAYGFSELAQLYMPDISRKSAGTRLKAWIEKSSNLYENLKEAGFTYGQRILTPKQVEILVNFLGEP